MIYQLILREIRFARREKPVLIGYFIVLLLWGILQPAAAILGGPDAAEGLGQTGFFTLTAFFLFMALGHSSQTFVAERNSGILNTLLSAPIRTGQLVFAKWLFGWLLVSGLALLIFALQNGIFLLGQSAISASFGYSVRQDLMNLSIISFVWAAASWGGAFLWLKFDTIPSANICSLLLSLPLLAAQYLMIERMIPFLFGILALLGLNLFAGALAIRLNTRDRLARIGQ